MPKSIFPLVALLVDERVRLFPLAVPPITDCPPEIPVERFDVIVFVARVNPVENVKADSFELNVLQSVLDNAPRFNALAVGTLRVITGVVVPVATVLDRSVPVVPSVNAATDVTVPTDQVLSVDKSYAVPLIVNVRVLGT